MRLMKRARFHIPILIVLSLVGILLFVFNYSYFFPSAFLSFKLNREQLEEQAITRLAEWGYHPEGFKIHTELRVRKGLLSYVRKHFTDPDSVKFYLSNEIPAYYWAVTWERQRNASSKSTQITVPPAINKMGVQLDQDGKELGFWIEVFEDSTMPGLSPEQAKILADSLVKARIPDNNYTFGKIKQQTYENRTEYSVTYNVPSKAGIPVDLEIDIVGNRIGRYEYVFENISDKKSFQMVTFSILSIVIVFLFVLTTIKKLRADELFFKSALPFGLIILVLAVMEFVVQNHQLDTSSLVSGVLIWPLFMGFFCTVVIACADTVTRDAWNDKLFSFDLMMRGKLYNPYIGISSLRGVALGLIFVGLVTLIFRSGMLVTFIDFVPFSGDVRDINSHFPFFFRLGSIISKTIWIQFVFVLFLSSFFARYFSRKRWVVLTVALFWAARAIPGDLIDSPQWFLALFYFLSGIYFVTLFIKYDFLTSFTAYFTYLLAIEAVRMFNFDHIAFLAGGSAFVILFLIIVIGAYVGARHDIQKEELVRFTPKHVKKILERERLRRELEIAKRVQMNFLPRSLPVVDRLDIASICLPAEEVGGDYYDFIPFDHNKLGIVIGDVSGKGISAAFYMTLTKGFLRSLVRNQVSPRHVLTGINSLFYENVERSHFISMVYGVFDMENMTFTFARAGHNPVIHRSKNGDTRVICPQGLALGLDSGPVFDQIIEETVIPLQSGDVFVMYTDGFSEAMNTDRDEFSEELLVDLIDHHSFASSHELISHLKKEIQIFTQSAQQHDDMTMLVVKVT